MDIKYAVGTLREIQKVWNRRVHLHARIEDDPILFTCDGEDSSRQQVDEKIEPAAHNF